MKRLTIDGSWFVDDRGRRVLLRGVNLGGSSKVPTVPDGRTHLPTDFSDHRDVSFVGRPFALDRAAEHYERLRAWGFNALRFLVTWEAIEHAGPGRHDDAYLDSIADAVALAGDYGLSVLVDPHQDVWSRMSGGDGAPGWTLEAVGFDVSRLDAAEAAVTEQGRFADAYRDMIWLANSNRLACATMFSLFFGGDRVAPGCAVEGEPVQGFLQRHFVAAVRALAERLAGFGHVLGYGTLNEPSPGYLGIDDLGRPLPAAGPGPVLTGLDSLAVGAGHPRSVRVARAGSVPISEAGPTLLNPDGASAWVDPDRDVWLREGVWGLDDGGAPELLRPGHFAGVAFVADCLEPFARRCAAALREVDPAAALFYEGSPGSAEPLRWSRPDVPVVNASHWYDVRTLMEKSYRPDAAVDWNTMEPVEGEDAVRASFAAQIGRLAAMSQELGGAPTLVGEFGVPMDLDGGASFRSGDFSAQEAALAAYYSALDANLVHGTLWNYTADNTNAAGDGWNREDLSIFSLDQPGGRAVRGFCRPTLRAAAGTPTAQRFDARTRVYTLDIDVDPAIDAPTTVYVPWAQYFEGTELRVSSGRGQHVRDAQLVRWTGAAAGPQRLTLGPAV